MCIKNKTRIQVLNTVCSSVSNFMVKFYIHLILDTYRTIRKKQHRFFLFT